MRIIAGLARGIKLAAPEGQDVRPTEDRVKETLFSMLGDLAGKTVVDLFAGTGALGLEALSRGATAVLAIEQNPKHVEYIQKNLSAVSRAMGVRLPPQSYQVFCGNAGQFPRFLSSVAGHVDLLLADPPYHPPAGAFGGAELLSHPELPALFSPDGLLVLEHADRSELPWYPMSPWHLLKTRVFGIRAISFAKITP